MAVPVPPVLPTGPLSEKLVEVAGAWARSQHRIVVLSAAFAESAEWIMAGSPTAAHWLAAVADVEVCTAREWIRVGKSLREVPVIADAFASGRLSYSKVRALTRLATADNEAELVGLASRVPAGELSRALAAWLNRNSSPEELAAHHERMRSVSWRNEPDGMVTFTLRLPPFVAGLLIAWLTTWVMTRRHQVTPGGGEPFEDVGGGTVGDASVALGGSGEPGEETSSDDRPDRHGGGGDASADAHPTLAQLRADAVKALVTEGGSRVETEVVVHLRGDGCALDDGTPVPDRVVAQIAPESFLRVLIHDADGHPVNASGRQRHPSMRQKRVVKERDRVCRDCGRADLLEYDHVPPFEESGQTLVDELELRCAPCHHRRHAA